MKVIFSKFQKPFPLHFPQLCRQRRPVHAQIVGELLAVEWDIKSLALIFYRLIGEVRSRPRMDFDDVLKIRRDSCKFFCAEIASRLQISCV